MNEIVFDRNGPLDWISENFTAFKLKSKGTTDSTKKKKKKKRIDTARRVIASIEIKMLFVELERIYITRKTGKNGNVNFIRQ